MPDKIFLSKRTLVQGGGGIADLSGDFRSWVDLQDYIVEVVNDAGVIGGSGSDVSSATLVGNNLNIVQTGTAPTIVADLSFLSFP